MKQKNKGVDFLLKGTLGARLLENMSTGKGVSRADNGVHRAGRGGGEGGVQFHFIRRLMKIKSQNEKLCM